MRMAAAAFYVIGGLAVGTLGADGEARGQEKDAGSLVVLDGAGREIKLVVRGCPC
jgi:hypothetical protein